MLKYQSREDLDDKEAHKYSVAPSYKIEKSRKVFLAPSAEIDKTTKESTNIQKVSNIPTMIGQL